MAIGSFYCRSVNGRTFYGVAKEKNEAAEEFQERIMAGENVGLVESRYCMRTKISSQEFIPLTL